MPHLMHIQAECGRMEGWQYSQLCTVYSGMCPDRILAVQQYSRYNRNIVTAEDRLISAHPLGDRLTLCINAPGYLGSHVMAKV